MAKVQYEENISSIFDDLGEMTQNLKSELKHTVDSIASELQQNTIMELKAHDEKIPRHSVHLSDDVRKSATVSDKKASATVSGGKETGKLWWLVDNGHIATNGRFVPGINFTDKAYESTDVESKVDNLLSRIK